MSDVIIQIVHIEGPRKGEIDELARQRITIGRDPGNDVTYPKDMRIVSRKHAVISREGNRYFFKNLSPNGCYLNGQLSEEGYLKQGDVLTFAKGGPKVSFLTAMKSIPKATRPAQPAPAPRSAPIPPPRPAMAAAAPSMQAVAQAQSNPYAMANPATQAEIGPFTIQYGTTIRSFKQPVVKLGKDRTNHFVLQHPRVYGVHAEIYYQGGKYFLNDLSASHATLLNSKAIAHETLLQENDIIEFSEGGPRLRYLGTGRFVEVM